MPEPYNNGFFMAKRGGLPRFRTKLRHNGSLRVAFLGGSITEGAGASEAESTSWRALTAQYLQTAYPRRTFEFINAGVGGTNSTLGAHRLEEHVLYSGAVDLLFVEFSVNDGEDRSESVRGMEGIVRQCRRLSPEADICFVYTAAPKNLAGPLPFNIAVHEEVADYYGIPAVNFAFRIYEGIQSGVIDWSILAPDGYHPHDAGHALYAVYMQEYLVSALGEPEDGAWKPKVWPPAPLEAGNYEHGTLLPYNAASYSADFRTAELLRAEPLMNWRFSTEHKAAEQPGAELSFTVTGQSAGVLLLYGPDSGIFEYSVNGEPFTPVNLFDDWCLNAYRPIPALFPVRTTHGPLSIVIRSTGQKDVNSKGTGLRVLKLLGN
ncbi:SGNH/GDSL hydrolase family protein [Paenibacillus tianjinensis]|uniref:SGNH/GDSL hydrolase family protein n=1 Tax=Paenibacillus tianjinensis TaxID=2810347 RepID=A0ABX7LE53_9BACL|nr:SGNH/GDSL hydrolase family protein [Paenibacillus tianjinensis]QSF46404.1 SGNH/GDSL hydrolase family protein [Paenibacillus tianjinensis]